MAVARRVARGISRAALRAARRAARPGIGFPSGGRRGAAGSGETAATRAGRQLAWRLGTIQSKIARDPRTGRFGRSAPDPSGWDLRTGGGMGVPGRPRQAGVSPGPPSAGAPGASAGPGRAAVPGGGGGAGQVARPVSRAVDTSGYRAQAVPDPMDPTGVSQRWTMPAPVRRAVDGVIDNFRPAGGPDGFRDRNAAISRLRSLGRSRATRMSSAQQETIRRFNEDSNDYYRIQDALEADAGTQIGPVRDGKTDMGLGTRTVPSTPGKYLRRGGNPNNPDDYVDNPSTEIKHLDDAMRPLEDDLILNYTTGLQAFGVQDPADIGDIDTWVGRRVSLSKGFRRAKVGSFTSVQDLQAEDREGPYVKVSLLAPKGTRAIVPGNGRDEVILDRETAVRISNITTDADGNKVVWALVEPRREFTEAPIALGRLPRGRDAQRRMGSLVRPRTPRGPLTSAEKQALEGLRAGHTPRSLRQLERDGVITAAERRALRNFDKRSISRQEASQARSLLEKLQAGEPREARATRLAEAEAVDTARRAEVAETGRTVSRVRREAGAAARAGQATERAEILAERGGRKPHKDAQPGNIIRFTDEDGSIQSGRIVSRDEDGLLTVSWRAKPGPGGGAEVTESLVDSADPTFRFEAPRVRRPRVRRPKPEAPKELEAGTQIRPRAGHTITEFDPETGQVIRRGQVNTRARNQDITVTWDDGSTETIPESEWGSLKRFRFETATQRRIRERTTGRTAAELQDEVEGVTPGATPPEEQLSRQSERGVRASLRRLRTSTEGEALPEKIRRKLLEPPPGDEAAAREGRVGWTPAERRIVTNAARAQYLREAEEARLRWRATVDALEQGARRLQERREGPKKPTKVTRETARRTVQDNSAKALSDPDGLVSDLRAADPADREQLLALGGRRAPYERVLKALGEEPQKSWSIAELARRIRRALGEEPEAPPTRRIVKSTGRVVTPPVKAVKAVPTKVVPTPVKAVKRAAPAETGDILSSLRAGTPEFQRQTLESLSPRLKGPYQAIARDLDIPHDARTTRAQLIDRILDRLAGRELPAKKVAKAAVKAAPPVKKVTVPPVKKAAPVKAAPPAKKAVPEAPTPPVKKVVRAAKKVAAPEPTGPEGRYRSGAPSLRRARTETARIRERDFDQLVADAQPLPREGKTGRPVPAPRVVRGENLRSKLAKDALTDARRRFIAGDDPKDIAKSVDETRQRLLTTTTRGDRDRDDAGFLEKLTEALGGKVSRPAKKRVRPQTPLTPEEQAGLRQLQERMAEAPTAPVKKAAPTKVVKKAAPAKVTPTKAAAPTKAVIKKVSPAKVTPTKAAAPSGYDALSPGAKRSYTAAIKRGESPSQALERAQSIAATRPTVTRATAPVKKAVPAAPEHIQATAQKLDRVTTVEDGEHALNVLGIRKKPFQELAEHLGVEFSPRDTIAQLKNLIAERTFRRRLAHDAYLRRARPVSDAPTTRTLKRTPASRAIRGGDKVDDAVSQEARASTAASRRVAREVSDAQAEAGDQSAFTPGQKATEALIPNRYQDFQASGEAFRNVHPDGGIRRILDLPDDEKTWDVGDGKAFANEVQRWAAQAVAGEISNQQLADNLKGLRTRLPSGSRARRALDKMLDDMGADRAKPRDPDQSLPADTPPFLRQLVRDFYENPLTRNPNPQSAVGREGYKTDLDKALDVVRQWSTGGFYGRHPGRIADAIRSLDNTHHESQEGHYDQRRAVQRALKSFDALTPAQKRSLAGPVGQLPSGGPPSTTGARTVSRVRIPAGTPAPGTSTPSRQATRLEIPGVDPSPEIDIRRTETGAITGVVGRATDIDRMLPDDTGPDGVPVRRLQLIGYGDISGTAWRRNGVTYLSEHTSTGADGAREWQRITQQHQGALPEEIRHLPRSHVLLLGESPHVELMRQQVGAPSHYVIEMETYYDGGTIITYQNGRSFRQQPGKYKYSWSHEVGHLTGRATGNIVDDAAPEYRRAVEAEPAWRTWAGWDFVPNDVYHIQKFAQALSEWRQRDQLPGKVKNGSTPYGRSTWGESFSEDHALYLMGRIGTWERDGESRPAYFRDLFPERAAYLDSLMPSFQHRQLVEVAEVSAPGRGPARGVARVAAGPPSGPVRTVRRPGPAGMTTAERTDYDALPTPGAKRSYTTAKNKGASHTEALQRAQQVGTRPTVTRAAPVKKTAPAKVTPVKKVTPAKKVVPAKAVPVKAAPAKKVAKKAARAPEPEAPPTPVKKAVKAVPTPTKVAVKKAAPAKAVPAKKAVPARRTAPAIRRAPGPPGLTDQERSDYNELTPGKKSIYTRMVNQGASHTDALERAKSGKPKVTRARGLAQTPEAQNERLRNLTEEIADNLVPEGDDDAPFDEKLALVDDYFTNPESPGALKGVNLERYRRWRQGDALTPAEETGLRTKLNKLIKQSGKSKERLAAIDVVTPTQTKESIDRELEIISLRSQLRRGNPADVEEALATRLASLESLSRIPPGNWSPDDPHRLRQWLETDIARIQWNIDSPFTAKSALRGLQQELKQRQRQLKQEIKRISDQESDTGAGVTDALQRVSRRIVARARQERIDRYTSEGFPPADKGSVRVAGEVLDAYGQPNLAREVRERDLPPRLARQQVKELAKGQRQQAKRLLRETAQLNRDGKLRPVEMAERIRTHRDLLQRAERNDELAKALTRSQRTLQVPGSLARTVARTRVQRRGTATPLSSDTVEVGDTVYLGRRGYGRVTGIDGDQVTVQRANAVRPVTVGRDDMALVRKGNVDLDRERIRREFGGRQNALADAEAERIDKQARDIFRDRVAGAREGSELRTPEGRRITRIVPFTPGQERRPRGRRVQRTDEELRANQLPQPEPEERAQALARVRAERERVPTAGETRDFESLIRTLTGRPWSEISNDPDALEKLRQDPRVRSTDAWNIINRAQMARAVVGFGPPSSGPGRRVSRVRIPPAARELSGDQLDSLYPDRANDQQWRRGAHIARTPDGVVLYDDIAPGERTTPNKYRVIADGISSSDARRLADDIGSFTDDAEAYDPDRGPAAAPNGFVDWMRSGDFLVGYNDRGMISIRRVRGDVDDTDTLRDLDGYDLSTDQAQRLSDALRDASGPVTLDMPTATRPRRLEMQADSILASDRRPTQAQIDNWIVRNVGTLAPQWLQHTPNLQRGDQSRTMREIVARTVHDVTLDDIDPRSLFTPEVIQQRVWKAMLDLDRGRGVSASVAPGTAPGRITATRLTPGTRLLVTPEGAATRTATGAIPVEVTDVQRVTVNGRTRLRVTARDTDGNLVTLGRGPEGSAPSQTYMLAPEAPTARRVVKVAAKAAPTKAAPAKKAAKAAVRAPVKKAAPTKKATTAKPSPERVARIDDDGRKAAVKFVSDIEENIAKGAPEEAIEVLTRSSLHRLGIRRVGDRYILRRPDGDVDLSDTAPTKDPQIQAYRRIAALASDVDSGDYKGTVKKLRARMAQEGFKPIEQPGKTVRYSPDVHDPMARMPEGTSAQVVRPGYTWTAPNGKRVIVARALVQEAPTPRVVKKAAPVKAAPAKAIPAKKVARKAVPARHTPEDLYGMSLPEARRVGREAFPDLPEKASRAEIVDRFTPDRLRDIAPDVDAPGVTKLRQLSEAGDLQEERVLGSNATARVTRLQAPDGTKVVSKRTIPDPRYVEDADAGDRTDAEYLASRLGRQMGADVPDVFSPSERTIIMSHVSGRPGSRLSPEDLTTAVSSPGGRRLHLLDVITGNTDRHSGNVIRRSDGTITGIDHSAAFRSNLDRRVAREVMPAPMHREDPFRSHYGAVVSDYDERGVSLNTDAWPDQVPFTRSELQSAKKALQELRPEFEQMGRGDWYRAALGRVNAMLRRATPDTTPRKAVKKAAKAAAVAPKTPEARKVQGAQRPALEEEARRAGVTDVKKKNIKQLQRSIARRRTPVENQPVPVVVRSARPVSLPLPVQRKFNLRELATKHQIELPEDELLKWQRRIDSGEDPRIVSAAIRAQAISESDAFTRKHRGFLTGDESGSREIDAERARIVNLRQLSDRLQAEAEAPDPDDRNVPGRRRLPTRDRQLFPQAPDETKEEEKEEDKGTQRSGRSLRAWIRRLIEDDDEARRRGRDRKSRNVSRLLGGPENGPDDLAHIPGHMPGGAGGSGAGAGAGDDDSITDTLKDALAALRGRFRSNQLPNANDFGDTSLPPPDVTPGIVGQHGPGLFPRPTSGIRKGRGGTAPETSPIRLSRSGQGPETTDVAGTGSGVGARRSGRELSPELENVLNGLRFGDASTVSAQLREADLSANDINALARRTGTSRDLVGIRGRDARLDRLAQALNRDNTAQPGTPFDQVSPSSGPPSVSPRRLVRRGRQAVPLADDVTAEEEDDLTGLEERLGDARRRLSGTGPTGRSGPTVEQEELAAEVAELEEQVEAARARINPNPNFWRQRDLAEALTDDGMTPLQARRVLGVAPEQIPAGETRLPTETVGRPIRVRRPEAPEVGTRVLELPPGASVPPVQTAFETPAPGSIPGVPSPRRLLSDDELNALGGDGVLAAYRQGEARSGPAARRLKKLADEMDAGARGLQEPDRSIQRAEAARLRNMANGISSGTTVGGTDSPAGGSAGGGQILLSAADIRDVLSKMQTVDQARSYLQSLRFSDSGIRALANSLGLPVRTSMVSNEVLELIANTVKKSVNA